MEKQIPDLAGLAVFAEEFTRNVVPRAGEATLVTLSGELGAGKTAFTKELAKHFGVEETVNSPTFVLEKIYQLANAPFDRLIHIDAYRLENGDELAPLAFAEFMRNSKNLILLEWPEKVADALPPPAFALRFESLSDGARKITYG